LKGTLRHVTENQPSSGWAGLPRNEIKDAQTARALAHPVRIKIIEQLIFRGAMTATELSELIDESPANTSWHLRQLARYGFIEEASGGTGRQRPWQMVVQSNTFADPGADRETAEAFQATVDVWLGREVEALRAWLRREAAEPEWAHAAYLSLGLGYYTLDELRTIGQQIGELLAPYFYRLTDPASRPPGARPVRTVQWGVPADSFEELTGTPTTD
jgi:DNA-binding transcriptional ArsR family regulator